MKKNLEEIVGVPENILESAERLFIGIINELKRYRPASFTQDSNIELNFNTSLHINELNINRISMLVEFDFVNTDKILIGGAGYVPRKTHEAKEKFVSVALKNPSHAYLTLSLYLPDGEDIDIDTIIYFLNDNSESVISSLSHELKHSYDTFKKPTAPLSQMTEYNSIIKFNAFGIKPLKLFFHNLYLSCLTETLVKPTEVAYRMMSKRINKNNFLEFLLNDETFEEFMVMKNYSFVTLYEELEKVTPLIRKRLIDSNLEAPDNTPDLIHRVLELAYYNLVNLKVSELKNLMMKTDSTTIEQLIGIDRESDRGLYLMKKINEYSKYRNNPLSFYKTEIDILNRVGNEMTKKIGKLYVIAQDDNDKDSDIIRKIYKKTNS